MLFLKRIGFPALGNIHLGNVFVTKAEDGSVTCAISGHDNALFGYRTSIFQKVLETPYFESLDVIMLGELT